MRSQLELFETGFNRFTRFLAMLVAASIGLITLLIPLNLFLIKFELGSMWWLYEGVEYALYIGVFIGAPWVLQQGAHVRVDVLVTALPRRFSARLERSLDIAGAALCLLLFYYGVRATLVEIADGTLPDRDLRIANFYMTAVFAFSFLALAIEFGLRFLRAGKAAADTAAARSKAGF
jgi:TRAP-type C4-dicarboxylate transport system permease small subunit